MTEKSEKRKTLSLKIDSNSNNNLKHSNKFSNTGINNLVIERKKRIRKGLNIDIDKPNSSLDNKKNSSISSKLTDTEFKVRVKVLQETLHKEQQEKNNSDINSDSTNNREVIDNTNTHYNINNIKQTNEFGLQSNINEFGLRSNTNDNKIENNINLDNNKKKEIIQNNTENINNKTSNDTVSNTCYNKNKEEIKYPDKYIQKQSMDYENNTQPVIFRSSDFNKSRNKTTGKSYVKNSNNTSNKYIDARSTTDSNNNTLSDRKTIDRRSKYYRYNRNNENEQSTNGNETKKLYRDSNRTYIRSNNKFGSSNTQDRLNREQKPKKWTEQNNERDKSKYNNKQNINKDDIKQKAYNNNINPNDIPVNKINIKKTKFNNDSDNKKRNNTNSKYSDKYSNTSKKITRVALDRAMNDESEERVRSLASTKRAIIKSFNKDKPKQAQSKVVREVLIPDNITVGELAIRMAVKASEVVKYLMSVGTMATINQLIDGETAEIVVTSFGHIAKRVADTNNDIDLDFKDIDDKAELVQRVPIVAVMGHVDHGKTTLLDTLRKSSVAQKEAGGITQHVAAYQVETKKGNKITFIDTPGHAAFTNIRARGAKLTDIIVLVVAADDGIKEQTIEVIKQAQSQNVPLVIAINKIDKPNININKIKTDLMNYDIVLEEFGGETLSCEISAKNNINLDKLLETILLQAEICYLKANPNRRANGTILESRIDKGRGIVSSVIIQGGTIKNGDVFVAGSTFGKVRAMYNNAGQKLNNIGPSTPIELIGFNSAPEPGDTLVVVENEQKAREISEKRNANKKNSKANKISIKSINQVMAQESVKVLNVFAKADVYGSLEAITASLESIKHPEITVKVIGKDIGIISESDIDFSIPSRAIVIGFNVNSTIAAKESAKLNNIKILNHTVIYHLIEEIKSIMSSMLDPIIEENYIGTADVKKLFIISRLGTIAGCYVSDGIIKRHNSKIKVIRNGKCIFEGKIKSMKHEKDEIKESKQNHECGILAEGYNDFQEGDKIECYEITQKMRTIE